MVKSLPAMHDTWVLFLAWKDLLEKEMATHSSILAWKIPKMEEPAGYHKVHVITKSWTGLNGFTFTYHHLNEAKIKIPQIIQITKREQLHHGYYLLGPSI